MKALFIGGTGRISTAVSELALKQGWELWLLNRGNRSDRIPKDAHCIKGDIENEQEVRKLLSGLKFDVVADFISFVPSQIERDIRLFQGLTNQYIFISSASAYQKPLADYKITESTPLLNPYWQYSQNKIACEDRLMAEYRSSGFPITIIRPSHTYDERSIPVAVHGKKGSWQVIDRILKGKPVPVPGDGLSLWTLTFSTDFAKAFVGLMGNRAAIGQAFHITSDEAITWDAIYDTIGLALSQHVEKVHMPSDLLEECCPDLKGSLIGDKANSVVFDNSKVKRLVPDFVCTVRFDQGVQKCIEFLSHHPEYKVPDPEFDAFCDRVANARSKMSELLK